MFINGPRFAGQGKVFAASRDANGNALAHSFAGNISALGIKFNIDVQETHESTSGGRVQDGRFEKFKKAQLSMTFTDFSKDVLAILYRGNVSTVTSGTVTAETLPQAAVGNLLALKQANVSSVVITDSTATPKTLVQDTHYRVNSDKHGSIEILDLTSSPGPFTQPFKAAYSYGGATVINMLTQPQIERWLRFEGLNTANANAPVLIDLYRVVLDPTDNLDLIMDDTGAYTVNGAALYDASKVSDTVLGQFGSARLLTA